MKYVKHFNILGIDTAQIPCIELQGIPTAATVGAVGLFGMNMLSTDHEIYVCVGVEGSVYNWIPLKGEGGITVTGAKVNDKGELVITLSNGTILNAGALPGSDCVKKTGDTISGSLSVAGQVLIPNSSITPEVVTITDSYSMRETAKGIHNVVDGAETFVTKITGNTGDTGDGFKNAYLKGIESGNKNLFNAEGENDKENDVSYLVEAGKVTCVNTSQWGTSAIFFYKTYPAGTYTFSAQSLSYSGYRIFFAADTRIDGTTPTDYYTGVVGQNCYDVVINNTTKYFTFTANSSFRMGIIFYLPTAGGDRTCTIDEILLVSGSAQENYIPYKGDNGFSYAETLELGKWDYALPQEGKVYKSTILYHFTGTETIQNKSETSSTNWGQEYYFYNVLLPNNINKPGASDRGLIAKNIELKHPDAESIPDYGIYWGGWSNEASVVFWSKKSVDKWATKEDLVAWLTASNIWVAYATEETVLDISPKAPFYKAYPNGYESVDNGGFGSDVLPTITQTYSVIENPYEAANKGFVGNSLAKKLDKQGGTITGNLIVEGKTDTELGAIISKKGDITYGLAYDNEAYKLGQGTVDENGEFTFNEGEGLPIALRDDSATFVDGNVVIWSADGNKFVDSGVPAKPKPLLESSVSLAGFTSKLVLNYSKSLVGKILEICLAYPNGDMSYHKIKFSSSNNGNLIDIVAKYVNGVEYRCYLGLVNNYRLEGTACKKPSSGTYESWDVQIASIQELPY